MIFRLIKGNKLMRIGFIAFAMMGFMAVGFYGCKSSKAESLDDVLKLCEEYTTGSGSLKQSLEKAIDYCQKSVRMGNIQGASDESKKVLHAEKILVTLYEHEKWSLDQKISQILRSAVLDLSKQTGEIKLQAIMPKDYPSHGWVHGALGDALLQLGCFYESSWSCMVGSRTELDPQRAKAFFKKAAEFGNKTAQEKLKEPGVLLHQTPKN